ncbi:four helix bundle protein [bacterium]|nr:four helix bundle protein [bacterium]
MAEKESYYFDHEKLRVYHKSIEFVGWLDNILSKNGIKSSIADQIVRASESIVLNIAEGNGKFTPKDRCKYFDISRGSAMECAGCLDVLFTKEKITISELGEGKLILRDIVNMLMGLIKSNSDRTYEPDEDYEA